MRTLKGLKPRLTAYMREFRKCIRNKRTRGHAGTYIRGQLGPLAAKSVEPIALEAGVAPRTLQKFLSHRKWDEEKLRRRHQVVLQRDHGGENAICVVDETSFPKKGEKTTGVKRQHCGTLGKVDNCVVSVHLGYVRDGFHALLDSDVFLPEDWALDAARRKETSERVVLAGHQARALGCARFDGSGAPAGARVGSSARQAGPASHGEGAARRPTAR